MKIIREDLYIVKNGDTLSSVCKLNKVSEKQLVKMNNISKEIEAGDILVLPASYSQIYIVKPNDTLVSIAIKHNTTSEHLKELNKIGDSVFIGQQILI